MSKEEWWMSKSVSESSVSSSSRFDSQEPQKPLRSFRFWMRRGDQAELIFLDDLSEDKSKPIFVYEHMYDEMLMDQSGRYTIPARHLKFCYTTCIRGNPDGNGCPMCDAGAMASKTGFLTVLVKKVSSKGNEYYVRMPFAMKKDTWSALEFQMSALGYNIKWKRFMVKRGEARNAPSCGNAFIYLKDHTIDEVRQLKIYDNYYDDEELFHPLDFQSILRPMSYQEMVDGIQSGRFVLKNKRKEEENKLTMEDFDANF